MGTAAGIFGGVGGLCAIMGIVTAVGVVPPEILGFTWMFWFVLSAILLLASIACALGRSSSYD